MKRDVPPSQPTHVAVKETIAELEGCRPRDLGTLGAVIDVDTLDAFGESRFDRTGGEVDSLEFRYCGYSIELFGDGTLYVKH
ncbi:hypothetical protein HWV07_10700 [Natronomonas salina]|uniref:HalOD1 output domain-containing protein n=1 Tax=Natronomonas salina TaxID=1710540 RepID=UPI0015B4894C|nr:HalOD1 output domain-containing protein [Natronomonas salina]QLD89471.1 hypothetical protein HWV07_10700 [Natronomonas salina]